MVDTDPRSLFPPEEFRPGFQFSGYYPAVCTHEEEHPYIISHDNWDPGSIHQLLGRVGIKDYYWSKLWCSWCGRVFGPIGKNSVASWRPRREYVWVDDTRTTGESARRFSIGECTVGGCVSAADHLHHMAPKAVFPDADCWPVVALCVPHHNGNQGWHMRMAGFVRRRVGSGIMEELYEPRECEHTGCDELADRRISLAPSYRFNADRHLWHWAMLCSDHEEEWLSRLDGYKLRHVYPDVIQAQIDREEYYRLNPFDPVEFRDRMQLAHDRWAVEHKDEIEARRVRDAEEYKQRVEVFTAVFNRED